jgi:hypothetical protein
MAGAGYKLFNTGDVLTAAQVNTYLQEQVVMVFASSTARTTALSGVLAEGMMSYLQDTNAVEVYDGTAWVSVGSSGDITGVTAGTGISGGGTSGTVTITNSMATEITAAGDIIVGTGSGTFDNLPIGTTGQILTADTTVSPYKVKWAAASGATFAGVSLKNSSGVQSIAHSTFTAITWAEEDFDTDAYHSTSSNTSRITIPSGKAGKYHITGFLQWDDNTSGNARNIYVYKNGTNAKNGTSLKGYYPTALVSCVLNLAVSDYIEIYVYQDSGSTRDTYPYGVNGQFAATYLGA